MSPPLSLSPGSVREDALKSTTPRLLLLYGLGAAAVLWPAFGGRGGLVPGAERSDIWDSLWSFWFVRESLLAGRWPLATDLLGFPDGGRLAVADLLNALAAAPLVPLLGLPGAWVALVAGHLVLAGWAAHRLAEEVLGRGNPAAGLAGLAYQANAVVLSSLHGGTSEAVGGGWLPLALVLSVSALRRGGSVRMGAAGLALAATGLACWYYGVLAFLAVGSLGLVGEGTLRARDRWVRLGPALLLGVALCAPVALAQVAWSTAPDNLVGIKGAHELAILRRTTGAVDPLAYLLPWDFRSPDFRLLSRYGEDFVHCTYLGWVLLIAATVGWIRVPGRRSVAWLALASGVAAVLSLGPVLVHDGGAVLLPGDRAIPLPYLLVERLPGFDRLSILFRLALLPALGVAVLAARAVAGLQRRRGLATVVVTLLAVGEVRLLSPVHGLPAWSDTTASAPIGALAGAPPGAVMNSPAVGGRRYLFEQTLHRKPLTCGLNFPESDATRAVWRVVLEETERADVAPNEFAARVETAACARGVGYLVVHDDPIAQPDRHQRGVRAIEATVAPMIEAPGLRAYRLCPPTLRAGRGG